MDVYMLWINKGIYFKAKELLIFHILLAKDFNYNAKGFLIILPNLPKIRRIKCKGFRYVYACCICNGTCVYALYICIIFLMYMRVVWDMEDVHAKEFHMYSTHITNIIPHINTGTGLFKTKHFRIIMTNFP